MNKTRKKRHKRIRGRIQGTAERPRLNVYRSNKHIYAQIINDKTGTVLASANDRDIKKGTKKEKARQVGEEVATKAQKEDIKKVVFDRGGYKYHGRVEELAAGARDKGLDF